MSGRVIRQTDLVDTIMEHGNATVVGSTHYIGGNTPAEYLVGRHKLACGMSFVVHRAESRWLAAISPQYMGSAAGAPPPPPSVVHHVRGPIRDTKILRVICLKVVGGDTWYEVEAAHWVRSLPWHGSETHEAIIKVKDVEGETRHR